MCFGATESQESSSGGRGDPERRHQHTGVAPRGPEEDPGRRGETRLLALAGHAAAEGLPQTLFLQVAGLKVRLKRQAAAAGSGVAHAFLRAQALLFGGYRDALQSPAVSDAPLHTH